jgi:hypothetical protein
VRLGQLAVAAIGAVTVALASWAGVQEANPFLNARLDGGGQLVALTAGELVPGLSSQTQQIYAEACLAVTPRLDARLLPAVEGARLNDACLVRIGELARRSPVNSFLWSARARLAFDAQDAAALNESLVLSGATAANEYWLVARRFALAERATSLLDAAALQQNDADMAMLGQTGPGSRLLAARYVLSPASRARITAAVEALPATYQQWFLGSVREFTRAEAP